MNFVCTEVLLPATGSHPGNPRLERLMEKYLPQDSSMVQLTAKRIIEETDSADFRKLIRALWHSRSELLRNTLS